MGKFIDLTGQKFNKLTVIEYNKKSKKWLCKCDCGNEKYTCGFSLRNNLTKSCGCHKYKHNGIEVLENHAEIIINSKKYGAKRALIDLEDIDKCKNYTWSLSPTSNKKYGFYIVGRSEKNKKHIGLHQLIMNFPNLFIDHINHNTFDNRKENLRVVSSIENQQNQIKCQSHNKTSGVKNVHWSKDKNKWRVSLTINKKAKHIGYYENLEEAKYKAAEARLLYFPFSQEALNVS